MSREKETDAKVITLKAEVEKRRKELAIIERPNFKTNLSFYLENKSYSQNLQVAKPEELVRVAALIEAMRQVYARISKTLMADPIELAIGGFTPEDWLHDIGLKLKKSEVTNKYEPGEKGRFGA